MINFIRFCLAVCLSALLAACSDGFPAAVQVTELSGELPTEYGGWSVSYELAGNEFAASISEAVAVDADGNFSLPLPGTLGSDHLHHPDPGGILFCGKGPAFNRAAIPGLMLVQDETTHEAYLEPPAGDRSPTALTLTQAQFWYVAEPVKREDSCEELRPDDLLDKRSYTLNLQPGWNVVVLSRSVDIALMEDSRTMSTVPLPTDYVWTLR